MKQCACTRHWGFLFQAMFSKWRIVPFAATWTVFLGLTLGGEQGEKRDRPAVIEVVPDSALLDLEMKPTNEVSECAWDGQDVDLQARELTPDQQNAVSMAIDRGIAYLRRKQLANGSFDGRTGWGSAWPVGFTALAGLALLESGIPADDPAVEKVAKFVRQQFGLTKTYEISLALLFLDRLGDPGDATLIRSLALRLAAGQLPQGGWGYDCPVLLKAQEEKLLKLLAETKLTKEADTVPSGAEVKNGAKVAAPDNSDNSNTQFALLALWAARKHEVPVEFSLARAVRRFRSQQLPDGAWGYRFKQDPYGSMTCVGLLALAVGHGLMLNDDFAKSDAKKVADGDPSITRGLSALRTDLADPRNHRMPKKPRLIANSSPVNLYFLWSVERVGVLCNLRTIGGKDWYRWGVEHVLPAQKPDGSWIGTGAGGFPVIDTSFALLFLKRSDLLPDLRKTLQKRLKITDPGLDLRDIPISPGDKTGRRK